MRKNEEIDGVLFMTGESRKQIYEFKKIFARSANLSNVDAKRWKLTLRKKHRNKNIWILRLYFDGENIDTWAVIKVEQYKVSIDNLVVLNEKSEKFFREEWFYGVKDEEGLKAMIGNVYNAFFGIETYPTAIRKAARFWYVIATKQMFNDGNKRTALLTALFCLQANGFEFIVKDKPTLYNISLDLANGKMSESQLVEYISRNTVVDFKMMNNIWESVLDKNH